MTDSLDAWQFVGGLGIFVASAVVCAVLILLLRPLLQRYALTRPNARSSHVTPTAQGGGIAVIAATLGVSLLVIFASGMAGTDATRGLWSVVTATVAIAIVGAVDDIRTIEVAPR